MMKKTWSIHNNGGKWKEHIDAAAKVKADEST